MVFIHNSSFRVPLLLHSSHTGTSTSFCHEVPVFLALHRKFHHLFGSQKHITWINDEKYVIKLLIIPEHVQHPFSAIKSVQTVGLTYPMIWWNGSMVTLILNLSTGWNEWLLSHPGHFNAGEVVPHIKATWTPVPVFGEEFPCLLQKLPSAGAS
jgi:hypothetical protein